MAKQYKLKDLQELFAGEIKKENNKYYVTFPGSKKEYGYRCNLKELALKLDLEPNDLDEDNTYDNKIDKLSLCRKYDEISENLYKEYMKENKEEVVAAIKNLLNKCKANVCDIKEKPKYYKVYLKINPKTRRIKIVETIADTSIVKQSGINRYYKLVYLQNTYGVTKFDVNKHIENLYKEKNNFNLRA